VVEAKVKALADEARAEIARIDGMGGALAAVESGYMKQRLVESSQSRLAAVAAGSQPVVGVNCFTETAQSPLVASDGGFLAIDAAAESAQIERLAAHRAARDGAAVASALDALRQSATVGRNVMPASIACARAGATTGEWAQILREVFGEYRAPTGVGGARPQIDDRGLAPVRARVDRLAERLRRRPKMLVGKPGLDGHSNGAEQIALCARDCGFEVVYDGIRLTPARIAAAALEEGVHVVGLSILSGSHRAQVAEVLARLRAEGLGDLPVVVGGIIPPEDAAQLLAQGVTSVFTPKDYDLAEVMGAIVGVLEGRRDEAA
jgi:(2R)-ethylmalonyl-CoA mutase